MSDLRQAAQQALEALKIMQPEVQMGEGDAAIKALKAALAEPVQEPVAWQERQARRMRDGIVTEWTDWYPCQYRTADKARAEVCDQIPYEWRPLYAAPPQRKPLTEEEIRDLLEAEFLGRDGKRSWDDDLQVFRLAERAQGIT